MVSFSIKLNNETEISEIVCPGKDTSDDKSSIDKVSQHLVQLCDKAINEQIYEIIDYGISSEKMNDRVTEISKILPENAPTKSQPTHDQAFFCNKALKLYFDIHLHSNHVRV